MQDDSLYQNKKEAIRQGWRFVRQYAKRYQKQLLVLLLLVTFRAVLDGFMPFVTGRLIDQLTLVAYGGTSSIYLPFLILIVWGALHLFSGGLDWVTTKKNQLLRIRARLTYIAEGMAHLLRLPLSFHKDHKIGAVTEVVNEGSVAISSIVANHLMDFLPSLLSVLVGIVICFAVQPLLAAILLLGIVIFILMLVQIIPKTIEVNARLHRIRGEAMGYGYDLISNIYAVKQAATETYEGQQLQERVVEKSFEPWYYLMKSFADRAFARTFVVTATQMLIFAASILFLSKGTLTVGEVVMFNGYANMVFWPFARFAGNWGDIQDSFVAAANAGKVMETTEERYLTPARPTLAVQHTNQTVDIPTVEFVKVMFRYKEGDPIVLHNISFSIRHGEKVALVGESGVGKSTLIDLISRYYVPSEGVVSVFGTDVQTIPLRTLRSMIAVVPQEVALFNSTILENIRYGSFDATDEDVQRVAREAQADEFIEKFPQKYEQLVGNRGVKLSVGQKQRVAIARAMLRDPKILILDEPTSALDPKTELDITAALERLMKGRTTFIVAHRLSTVRKADRIFVIKDGKIVEEGNHHALLAIPNGEYRKLYELHIGLHE